MGKATVRIGSIVIDVKDFDRMLTFWQKTLGYAQGRPLTLDDPVMILKDPAGKGPNVSLDGMEPYRNRLNLDLYTDDPEGQAERLLRPGGSHLRPREHTDDFMAHAQPD